MLRASFIILLGLAGCFETRRFFVTGTGGPDCGDGKVNGKEACDGGLPRGHDACVGRDSARFVAGTLVCKACGIDESACVSVSDSSLRVYLPLDGGTLTDLAGSPSAAEPHSNGTSTTSFAGLVSAEGRVGSGISLQDAGSGFGWAQGTKVNVPIQQLATVSVWLRPSSETADGSAVFSDGVRRIRLLKSASDFLVMVEVEDGSHLRTLTFDHFVQAGEWVFVASVIDAAAGETRAVLIPSSGAMQTLVSPIAGLPNAAVGKVLWGANATLPSFKGTLDEAKMWNTARSEEALCAEAGGTVLATAHYCVFQ